MPCPDVVGQKILFRVSSIHLCWWRRFISPHSKHKKNTRRSRCDSIDGLFWVFAVFIEGKVNGQ